MKLNATIREKGGTNRSRQLRKTQQVPAVVYGHGEPQTITVELTEVEKIIHSNVRIVELEVGGKTDQTIIHDVQFDTFGDSVIHLDFKRVALDETVRLPVALNFTGQPQGLLTGGIVDYHLVDLEIECQAKDVPREINVAIEHLDIGDVLHINEITLPDGVRACGHPMAAVVQCAISKKMKVEEDDVPEEADLGEGEGETAPAEES